jgi:hypothetical protein
MRKRKSGAGMVCLLNGILAAITAAALYFGVIRSSAERGGDIGQGLLYIGGNARRAFIPVERLSAPDTGLVLDEDTRIEKNDHAGYRAVLAEIAAKKQQNTVEEDRLSGLFARLEASVREKRYAEARSIARDMETLARQKPSFTRYLYLARSVSRLVENASDSDQMVSEGEVLLLREELSRLKTENEMYQKTVRDARTEQHFVESALSLQESNRQIQEMLLQMLQNEYTKSQEALAEAVFQLSAGETFTTIAAKERVREGYQEGVTEARELLERSLRIRSRESRIAFLSEARTRYTDDESMTTLIDTLLERL